MKIKQKIFTRYDLRHNFAAQGKIPTSSMERQIAQQILENVVQEAVIIRRKIRCLNKQLMELPEIARDANMMLDGYNGYLDELSLRDLINRINDTNEEEGGEIL